MGFRSFLKFSKTICRCIIDIILTGLLPDIIATSKGLGMDTKGGALALVESEPDGVPIVDRVSSSSRVFLDLQIYFRQVVGRRCYHIW